MVPTVLLSHKIQLFVSSEALLEKLKGQKLPIYRLKLYRSYTSPFGNLWQYQSLKQYKFSIFSKWNYTWPTFDIKGYIDIYPCIYQYIIDIA